MPDGPSNVSAVAELDEKLQVRWPGSAQLNASEVRRRFPSREGLVATWRVLGALPDPQDVLLVSVDGQFPWTLPRIALAEPKNCISHPHIEADGQICVVPTSAVYELPVGIRHVESLIDDVTAVLAQGNAESNDEDFFTEAHSYWTLIAPAAGSFLLINRLPTVHSLLSAADCGLDVVVGESKNAIETWAQRAQQKVGQSEQALLIALDAPLHPRDYPLTPRDLVEFSERAGASHVLRVAVMKWAFKAPLRIVISFPHSGSFVYLGGEVQSTNTFRLPSSRKVGVPGFRSKGGSATARLAAISQNPSKFKHWRAFPIYRSFLRERTAGIEAGALDKFHVVVVGCGALGGQLAVQLAQAGVGRLSLLDNEDLDWRNVGRHVLDGTSVGKSKAHALKEALLRRFPDSEVDSFARSWEQHFTVAPDLFDQADLVISATAEPASNLHLDDLSKSGYIAPVMFGWMEPFAVSSHAVFRHPAGPGLSDIVDEFGLLLEPVVDMDMAPTLPREPSCGAIFQPYSSHSALACVGLVAALAIDTLLGRVASSVMRTWVGPASAFHDNSLSITPVWHERINRQGFSTLYDQTILEVPK